MKIELDNIVSWSKRRGFLYPGSEIYGGLSNARDFGHYGTLLKNNIKDLRWKNFVLKRDDIVGLDSQILMNQKVWEASGHVEGFNDPLMDCKKCKTRHRADKLIETYINSSKDKQKPKNRAGEGTPKQDLTNYIYEKKIVCPNCGALDYTEIRNFNLLFKTHQGVLEDNSSLVYLRGETCQGIFINFKNFLDTMRLRVPFGVAQIGKAFRNEIAPGSFIYRLREFEQMEIEYFVEPENAKNCYEMWKDLSFDWRNNILGIKKSNIRARKLPDEEAAHYSDGTHDFEYKFPWGWGEIQALNNRTDFDLKRHEQYSKKDMKYVCPKTGKRFHPFVIEKSLGLTRTAFVTIVEAYNEENYISKNGQKETRTVLKFPKNLAPIKLAILPLIEKDEQMNKLGKDIFNELIENYVCEFDNSGNIGKRYRRQDEIGTPYCLTIDHQSLQDSTFTIRDRDNMKQSRIKLEQIKKFL